MFVGMHSEHGKSSIVFIVAACYLLVLVHRPGLHMLRVEVLEVPGVPEGPEPLLVRLLLGRPDFP